MTRPQRSTGAGRGHPPPQGLDPRGHWRVWVAFLLYLGFVVYGSLLPFDYRPLDFDLALVRFGQIQFLDLGVVSRADWIANICLYVPLAYLGCAALLGVGGRSRLAPLGAVAVGAFCLATAVGVEFAQQWFVPRTVSQNDLIAESIGTMIGLSIWIFGQRRIGALVQAFRSGGRPSLLPALLGYGVVYLVLSLFPYDFVLSGAELAWRLESHNQGWLLAASCSSPIRCAAGLALDALAAAPFGLLAALLWPGLPLSRLFAAGIAIGLAIEPVQLLLASGVAQGLSVPLRGLGLVAGGIVGGWLRRVGPIPVARAVAQAGWLLAAPYLAGLVLVSGLFSLPALPLDGVLARLGQVPWLPFHYHYFTTEPVAVASALAQLALYAPLGIWAWGLGTGGGRSPWLAGPGLAATAALVLVVPIELGKLFFPPNHPDPTNLLFAVAGALLAYWSARWLGLALGGGATPDQSRLGWDWAEGVQAAAVSDRAAAPAGAGPAPGAAPALGRSAAAEPQHPAQPRPAPVAPLAWPSPTRAGIALGALAAVPLLAGVVSFPLAWPVLAALLALYGVLLWLQPLAWLALIPALLPVLDLSPIAGRLPLDAFDLTILTTLAVAYPRTWGAPRLNRPSPLLPLALVLLWASWAIASARGLWPLLGGPWPPPASSHSPLEAWMVGKGMLWALLLAPLLRRVPEGRLPEARRLLVRGTGAGLALLALAVLWERQVFVGIGNLADPFRVTGTFATLATGGAYIEGFLVFALALAPPLLLLGRDPIGRSLGAAAGLGGLSALYVTYSRGGYLGMGLALAVLALGALRLHRVQRRQRLWLAAGLAGLILAGGLGLVAGGAATERLRIALPDLTARLGHWGQAIGLARGTPGAWAVGAGFGQYPAAALLLGGFEPRPGSFAVLGQGGQQYLRLGSGQNLYLDQLVEVRPGRTYELQVRLREGGRGDGLKLALCEKALLYSFDCDWYQVDGDPQGADWDGTDRLTIQSGRLGSGGHWPHRPVRLSIYNGGTQPVDVVRVSLKEGGRELIANGAFERGTERWLHTSDQKEAWHIDQLLVEVYFAQGLLGVLALALLLGAAGWRLWPGLVAGDPWSVALAAALTGLLGVGLTGSLLDAAPTALLLYLGALAALWLGEPVPAPARRGRQRRRRSRHRSERTDVLASPASDHRGT